MRHFLIDRAAVFRMMEVELRAVGISFSRPGSLPPVLMRSSPRIVPLVCDGIFVFDA
jgi:hypothetical protein